LAGTPAARARESDGGIVTDIGVAKGKADAPLLVPSVERHRELFGKVPWMVATDRGFYSAEGEAKLREMKVRHPVVPKRGHKSAARRAHERLRWFKRGVAWRAGGEGRISGSPASSVGDRTADLKRKGAKTQRTQRR